MAKRFAVLVGMLAVLLVAAVPAFAQQQTTATGVLQALGPAPEGRPGPLYAITDEETGEAYELFSVQADLEPFVGERVTVSGVGAAAPPSSPVFSNLLGVTGVVPADGTPPVPSQEDGTTTTPDEGTTPDTTAPGSGSGSSGSSGGESKGGGGTAAKAKEGKMSRPRSRRRRSCQRPVAAERR
jgi:hypothetical protein